MNASMRNQENALQITCNMYRIWFEQFGFAEGEYGVAETLSKAKDTSLAGMVEALSYDGLVQSWPEIMRLAREGGKPKMKVGELFGDED